ncbi:MAG: phosphoribosylamine--glycine ligase [Verrucomicrobia bacterium]|nr:MAG: phosphoribosylamine--glycine ligase [Verrucomicrobiota bacterium]
MRILVVGKGGREHALVTALHESPSGTELFAFPGSDAIHTLARPVTADSLASLASFMQRERIDLCVAGEESYLIKDEGLASACAAIGVPCWGPPKESAQLEASKEFAKQFMLRHGIPTASYQRATTYEEARNAITHFPTVLKFDGLAAGKGVAICHDSATAEAFLREVFLERRFGPGDLLVEECLFGPEISIFAAVSGADYQILAPARDYKRIRDNDEGPNTGGMGAVSCREGLISPELLAEIERDVVAPTIQGLQADGLPYQGFLYFGLMLTDAGPKVLEYNCRFGDPEAQAVLPLIQGDLARYIESGARGKLEKNLIRFSPDWSVCVILASAGYPDQIKTGDLIQGLEAASNVRIYHAGTRRNDAGNYLTQGGRVLAVVAQAPTREAAVAKAHSEAAKIRFEGCQRRTDIGRLHFETP